MTTKPKRNPPPPKWMSKEAKAEWKRVIGQLMSRKTLSDADFGTLKAYCAAMGEVRRCHEELNADGVSMFVQSDRSAPRPHPAYRLMTSMMGEARKNAVELGLTPASRKRSSAIEAQRDTDGWNELGVG